MFKGARNLEVSCRRVNRLVSSFVKVKMEHCSLFKQATITSPLGLTTGAHPALLAAYCVFGGVTFLKNFQNNLDSKLLRIPLY